MEKKIMALSIILGLASIAAAQDITQKIIDSKIYGSSAAPGLTDWLTSVDVPLRIQGPGWEKLPLNAGQLRVDLSQDPARRQKAINTLSSYRRPQPEAQNRLLLRRPVYN